MKTPTNIRSNACFTLVELLVSMAILTLLLVMMASIVNQTSSIWSSTRGKIEQFREARDGFEAMTRRISQATLNTYWDYQDATGSTRTSANSATFIPARYARQSELRFISGPSNTYGGTAGLLTGGTSAYYTHSIFFQAPMGVVADTAGNYAGLQYLLNTWGYYIEYANDKYTYPSFVKIKEAGQDGRNRFRLMEFIQPSEDMNIYTYTSGPSGSSTYNGKDWYTSGTASMFAGTAAPVHMLAENIIALVILPQLTPEEDPTGTLLSPKYLYDSTTTNRANAAINPKNQLPPVVQVTMVAIDEASAVRMTKPNILALKTKLSGLFTNARNYIADIRMRTVNDSSLESYLIKNKINYRIFTTNVSIKGAKWSRAQIN